MTNPLRRLEELGQSVWLDFIQRSLMTSGELSRLVEVDGVTGVTSNPSIFEKAIRGSNDYDGLLASLRSEGRSPREVYEKLAVEDIRSAADLLKNVYQRTEGRDGFVSLEVSPLLANDTEKTRNEARRLWREVDRPNVMIKVPGTAAGLPAFEGLIAEGINVNVTLLFARSVYEGVIEAYLSGLEKRAARGEKIGAIASVASFFVSRIDGAVDARLSELPEKTREALFGRVAVANAKLAYRLFQRAFQGARFRALQAKGARPQRLLWASTSTKNPAYSDTLYVDELIGSDTVNTLPMATLEAYRDHGDPSPRLTRDVDEAEKTIQALEDAGISLEGITDELTRQGVRAFADSFESLLAALDRRARRNPRNSTSGGQDATTYSLPSSLATKVEASLDEWERSGRIRRLWERDASLWTGKDEGQWLGWLGLAETGRERNGELTKLSSWARAESFQDAVVLGMGGSSLCPEVLRMTFGRIEGFPDLHILDSTDPAQIRTLVGRLDMTRTLFIVSSKSGTTLEPNLFKDYFFDRVRRALGSGAAPERFIAVTDPGSKLEEAATRAGFHRVFHGIPSVGGRYSALSNFGMVPGAVMGLDVTALLNRAREMVAATSSSVPISENPGAKLGAVLGNAATAGKDKLTLVASPAIRDFGAWLEQLIAESTGKQGRGIIPVDGERLGTASVYGDDRLFVYLRLESDPDGAQDAAVDALEGEGEAVVRVPIAEIESLGGEFFRWEIATAVAGSILGINPFDQPDVEASKVKARKLTDEVEKHGKLPPETALFEADGIRLFTDDANRARLGERSTLASYLRAHLDRLEAGDYFAVLAYLERNERNQELLQSLRHRVRNERRVATCLGFGPRFLHSTGQAYKGGPASGVFLQITCEDEDDLTVPGHDVSFGQVKAAQARGDLEVLTDRGRRALRAHLGPRVGEGLARLERAIAEALS
jgi:transaldolase / glucose-6-phosphate isomerase